MANSGYAHLSNGGDELFLANFSVLQYIVSPSGSCVLHLKEHLHDEQKKEETKHIGNTIYEFTEFVIDILQVIEKI